MIHTIRNLQTFEDVQNETTLVATDEDGEGLLKFVCNRFFGWKGRFALVKELMNADDSLEVRQVLSDNNLDPSLVDEFKALFEKQEHDKRQAELEDELLRKLEIEKSKAKTKELHKAASTSRQRMNNLQKFNWKRVLQTSKKIQKENWEKKST